MNEQNINPGIFGLGNPNNAYSQYFSGRSWLKMLTVERLVTANVTFEEGCPNNCVIAATTGTCIIKADKFCSLRPAAAGIRRTANLPAH